MSIKETSTSNLDRFSVTRILVELGGKNINQVLPLFEQALIDDNADLRWTALHELIELGKIFPQKIVNLLEQTIDKQFVQILDNKSRVLVDMGQELEQHLPVFKHAVQSHNADLQWISVLELIELADENPKEVISLFEDILNGPHPHLKWMITLELHELAKRHPDVITPALRKKLDDKACIVSTEASSNNESQKVIDFPVLEQKLSSDDPDTQWAAAIEVVHLIKNNPNCILPFLPHLIENASLAHILAKKRILIELGQESLSQVLPILEKAIQHQDIKTQLSAILELFALLEENVKKLALEITSCLQNNIRDIQQQVVQLTDLIERMLDNCHPDLQWTILHHLLKIDIFSSEKCVALIDKIIKKRITHNHLNTQSTRILVELGQKYPTLTEGIFKEAIESTDPEIHWAAILELQALIQLSPQIANYFRHIESQQ